MTKTNEEKIYIQVNDEIIELVGAEKEAFIADRQQKNADYQAQVQAKVAAKQAILDRLGLTEQEAALLSS